MHLHPGPEKRRIPQAKSAEADPIWRALSENEDWYQDLVEHSQDLLCIHDLEGRLLSVNPAPARLLGYSVEEMLQIPMREMIPPEFWPQFDAYLSQIESTGEARGLMKVMTRSGERRIWEYHNTLRREGVAMPTVRGIGHDVTEQRETEKRMRELSEHLLSRVRENERTIAELKLFRTLVDQSNDGIEVVDPKTLRYLDINQAACSELGYSREELLSLRVFDINPTLTESQVKKINQELEKSGSFVLETVHRRKDGSTFPVEVSLRRVDAARNYVVNIVRNLTERKQAETRLREYERVVEELEEMIVVVDRDYRYVIANREMLKRRGLKREELLGRTVMDQLKSEGMSEEALAMVKEKIDECFQGKVVHYELTYRYPSLGLRDLSLSYFPIEGPAGINRIACVLRDVTERKHAEAGLKKSEEKFSKAFRQSPMALTLSSIQNHQYIDVNETFERLTGWRRDEVIGRTALDLGLWDEADGVDLAKMLLAEGCVRNVEARYRIRDGSIRIGLSTAELIELDGEPCMLAVTADITERKQAEQTLRESEAYLAEAQRLSHTGSGTWRVAGRDAVHLSEEWYRIYGFDPKEGLSAWEKRLQRIPPEDRDRVEEEKDRAIRERSDYEVDHRILLPDGTVKYAHTVGHPVLNASGELVQFLHTMMDITERKQAEEALRRSEESYRMFISQSSEGIFREEMDAPVSIDLPEDELIHHILYDFYVAECNDALARMYGVTSSQEFVGKRFGEIMPPEDPRNIELARQYIRSGFRVLDRESHEVDVHGNPKIFLNSMIGTVENGMLVRTWGIQRDITEKVRLEEARKRAEEAIAALLQVRADSSENFFSSMAIELAKCLEADYTIIGELVEGEVGKVKTIGVCGQGVIAENFTRELTGTPCGLVIAQGTSSYSAGVTEIFPKDFLLKEMKVEGYAGTPLRDSQGRTIGLMVALYIRPLATAKFAEMILQLFSTRTAAEVERKRTEEALRQSDARLRIALSGSPIKVFNQDRDLRYTWVYNLPEGWTEKDYLGKTDQEVFGPETAATMEAIKRPVLESGRGRREEFTLTARGKTYYCDITVEPLIDAAGETVGVNCSCVDITHLREVTEELRLAKEKLAEEKLYLEEAIDTELGFGEIVGHSRALKEVMAKVAKVAPSDATVLLLGETGTGKELVARALHRMSLRERNSFIKLNCAAIPSGLLESELFGHEKGAFTGAVARKLGRLELADRGTLFLDEIGEIPLSLQPKLLRVLQDQEFERLGGTQTLKVNFRLLAATNRDLLKSVEAHEFRSDLYYRLNVFPITIPPLRDRREDIRPLVEHFVRKFAAQMKKSITSIPAKTVETLVRWDWPGNIRELENFMERSVILTPGAVLQAPLSELETAVDEDDGRSKDHLKDKERERILRVLRDCHGQLGGPDGAAARLGIKRTTLQSKLDHLGIKPARFRA